MFYHINKFFNYKSKNYLIFKIFCLISINLPSCKVGPVEYTEPQKFVLSVIKGKANKLIQFEIKITSIVSAKILFN